MHRSFRFLCSFLITLGLVACPDPSGPDGNPDGTPTETHTVRWSTAPVTSTRDDFAEFAVTCAPESCSLTCALDGAALGPCPSPLRYTGLAVGPHRLRVVATWGNVRKELEHLWQVDHSPPSVVSARFDAYGEIKVVFDEAIDSAAAATLSNYSLGPSKPEGLTVVGSAVAGEVLRLYLSSAQLPMNYTLTLTARDVAGNVRNAATVALDAGTTGSRVAFVTSARGDGNIRQWSAVPSGSNPATGLAAADAICQSEAQAAGLVGTFRAFLSDSRDDAGCRLLRRDGKLQNQCGLATAPVADTGPWLATDGLPLARSHEEVLRGNYLRPVRYDAKGVSLTTAANVWHATSIGGTTPGQALTSHCQDWSAGAGSSLTAASALVSTTRLPFLVSGSSSCTGSLGLVCLQVDAGGFALGSRYRQQGKVAFVTSTRTTGAIASGGASGLASADARCRERAAAAGLSNSSHFVAWLSDANADAYCRVLGQNAKRSASPACGLASSPATGPWVTTTGFTVASNLDALVTSGPSVPIFATESEAFPTVSNSWTGTKSDGTWSGASCTNWTTTSSGSTGGTKGLLVDTTQWSALASAAACGDEAHLLCLER